MLPFLYCRASSLSVASEIAPCLWEGATIIVKREKGSFVTFSEIEKVDRNVLKCLKQRLYSVNFGCSNNSDICVTDKKENTNPTNLVQKFNILSYINIFARFLLICFTVIWIFRIYFGKIKTLFYYSRGKEDIIFMAIDKDCNPLSGTIKEYKSFVGILKDYEKKCEITHSTIFYLAKYVPNTILYTYVVFPIKEMPFRIVFIKRNIFNEKKLISPLDYDKTYVYLEDCLDVKQFDTYVYSNYEAGSDIGNSRIRIKRKPGYFYSQNAINYHAYRCILAQLAIDILISKPTLENFEKNFQKLYEALNFDAVCFFVVRSGMTKTHVKLGDQTLHAKMLDLALNVKGTNFGKTSNITNQKGVRYAIYAYTLGETKYVTIVAVDLKHFILRGPERIVSFLASMETIFYHMNLSNWSEKRRTESLVNFCNKIKMFQILEVDTINGVDHIINCSGEIFPDITPNEVLEELKKYEYSNEKATNISNFFGKSVLVNISRVDSESLQKITCIYAIIDVTEIENDDKMYKEVKASTEIIYKNLGRVNMIDNKFNVKDAHIIEELGYKGESIRNIIEFLFTEDVQNFIVIEKRKNSIFRLRDVNGNGVWYGSKYLNNPKLYPYLSIIYRLPDLGNIHGIKDEVQDLDETLLSADRKGFGVWFIDQTNGHILISIPHMENIISDCLDLIGYVYEDDKQEFTDCVRAMNAQIKQIRTIRMDFATKSYEWYECTFYMTTPTNGIIIAVNVHQAKMMSDELTDVQEQIDLSLYHSNIVQWEFSENDNSRQIFTSVPVTFQALPLNKEFIEHNVTYDFQEVTREAFKKCLKDGVPINIEIPIVIDQIVWVSIRGGRSEAGDRLFGVYFDMTELMTIKEDLKKQKQSAIAASLAKSEFLANMSHEIRAPLQGIIAVLELLIMSSTTPVMLESLMTIKVGFYRLLELLNDTLDLAKIEQGRMLPSYCSFNVADVIEPVVCHFRETIAEKNIQLILNCNANMPIKYEGDPHFVERITHNFISNAVKFTSQGKIAITVDGDSDKLKVIVEDTGIGIPPEMMKIMFNIFTKLDSSLTRPYQGSGVGLSVVAKLIDLVGGEKYVESTLGKGSKFCAIFPFKSTYHPYLPSTLRNKKFLQVYTKGVEFTEDQKSYFEFYGFVNEEYPSTSDLPIRIISVCNTESDIKIATEMKKKNPDAQVLIILKEHEKPLCTLEGVDFVYYPIFPTRLRKRLISEKLMRHLRMSYPMGTNVGISELNMRVLLADDNQTNQIVMSKILSKMKCTYKCASNGQEVIDALEKDKYDIVLMDQHMPILDGPSATRIIRNSKDKAYCNIPIVAMTASILKEDEDECLNSGMTAFVTKPVSMSRLANVLSQLGK